MKKLLRNEKLIKPFSVITFTCFLVILTWLIIFKFNQNTIISDNNYKLMGVSLFTRIKSGLVPLFVKKKWLSTLIDDFIPNVIAFMPFGVYFYIFNEKHELATGTLIAFFFSLFFEVFQLITSMGCFDVNDLIANTLGYLAGYFVFYLISRVLTVKAINYLNVIIAIIAIPICVIAIRNTLINFEFYQNIIYSYVTSVSLF